ncbi:hypothetical protein BJY01DRAFT_225368 [Aspergillus pseudoustus]|uniref:F-box domain-containing protein n=1 Tax=Aspergillus pseudoustus TaxID=1810923 RepID=A0ABR4IZG1_9EURO
MDSIMSPTKPVLPPEVILIIIEDLIPSEAVILPPIDPVTRTLHSLTLASRITYCFANPLLLKHCFHISSTAQVERLLKCSVPSTPQGTTDINHPESRSQISSLYLDPTIDPSHTAYSAATQIATLFSTHCGNLRRLVLDTTWTSFYNCEDSAQTLTEAFRSLPAIEEFVSIQETRSLRRRGKEHIPRELWAHWPRLRRLALYGAFLGQIFIAAIQECPRLTHLVLGSPMGSLYPLPDNVAQGISWEKLGLQSVTVVSPGQPGFWSASRATSEVARLGWKRNPLGRLAATFDEDYPVALANANADANVHEREQRRHFGHVALRWVPVFEGVNVDPTIAWMRERALDGTLWERHGELYRPKL